MFVDRVVIEVRAGNGGNGVVAWRREKYIPKGGPFGGNGGKGGSVIFYVDPNVDALDWFKHATILQAPHGGAGQSGCKKGKNGTDLILHIPPGTQVKESSTGALLFDADGSENEYVVCQGGRGGRGNHSFRSSTNRAPNVATPGLPGEIKNIELELKLIADVGLVGFPNAGKSTFLSVLCHRHVKIAPYPFTTLSPNLGFISLKEGRRVLLADIPGIIEGAHTNRGLGLDFLRHIERTKALVFIVDIAGVDGRNPIDDFGILKDELKAYNEELLDRPSCVILNKMDIEGAEENKDGFRKAFPQENLFEVSCVDKSGLKPVIEFLSSFASPINTNPQK